MTKALRLSERWFNRGLWIIALLFAASLTGLGSAIVGDLPRVEREPTLDQYIDQSAARPLRASVDAARQARQNAADQQDQAELKLDAARQAYQSAREAFANWLSTRAATGLPSQDRELISRTEALDGLKAQESTARTAVNAQQQAMLDAEQALAAAIAQLDTIEQAGSRQLNAAIARAELRVFLYRLGVTLPLLVIAGWLFAKKRRSAWWPFVWGFIFFALYAFFVELVPYLPSYGGYIRYIVGIIVTVLVGRYAIMALNRYLAQQKLAEQQPEELRRETLAYDTALVRLSKKVCPSCERGVDLGPTGDDFCPHCGIGLYNHCPVCTTRKSAFSPYCHKCGTQARVGEVSTPSLQPMP